MGGICYEEQLRVAKQFGKLREQVGFLIQKTQVTVGIVNRYLKTPRENCPFYRIQFEDLEPVVNYASHK